MEYGIVTFAIGDNLKSVGACIRSSHKGVTLSCENQFVLCAANGSMLCDRQKCSRCTCRAALQSGDDESRFGNEGSDLYPAMHSLTLATYSMFNFKSNFRT